MSDVGCRMSDCGLRIADWGCWMSDCGLRIADWGLGIADWGCWIGELLCKKVRLIFGILSLNF